MIQGFISEKFSVLPSIAFFKISKMDSEKSIIGVIIILKKKILLIDSYHPSFIMDEQEK